ncbi:hypothetical protein CgunFtcFv8_026245 [Champsocephalus gunnari]|uniref:Uncharacterized protein n=1 Tax=Champsocephalus gunnari TaxID=52237 RepID=A0AAN8CCT5_CHAGU|nr:hypothetical protein CgunFtcFv8_026245 [Champsocephalus gunnari]
MPRATPLKKKKVKKSKMEPDAVDEEGLVSPAETTAEEKKKGKKGKKVDGQEEVQSEDQPAGGNAETEKEPETTDASLLASGQKKKHLRKKLSLKKRQRIQKKETQKHRAEWRHMEESKMAKIHKCRRNELLFSFGRGRRKCDESNFNVTVD